jgi:hypothetical protein
MLNWDNAGPDVYCNNQVQFHCIGNNETATKKAEQFVRVLAALEAMHTLTRDATDNREELIP